MENENTTINKETNEILEQSFEIVDNPNLDDEKEKQDINIQEVQEIENINIEEEKDIKIKELEQELKIYKLKEGLQKHNINPELSNFLKDDVDLISLKEVLGKSVSTEITFIPKNVNVDSNSMISKEDFRKMSYTERIQLAQTNRDLYNTLLNQ